MKDLPALQGLRVLDLSRVLAGPFAAQILADLGADVIKIERPGKGDDTRLWVPPRMVPEPKVSVDESVYFWACNRGKRSMTADISTPQGREVVLRLARDADAVIENYRVDTLSRYGLDYASLRALNPRLIYCSITGFGQTGPYRERPGYDTIIQAIGGLMSITGASDEAGGTPVKSGLAVVDQMTSLYAVIAILAALQERHTSGLGQHIDMSLLDVQVAALTNIGMNYLATGNVPKRHGNRLATVYPSDSFRCRDGDVMLIVGSDDQFQRFCSAMDLAQVAQDQRFSTNEARLCNAAALESLLKAAFSRYTMAECQRLLDKAGVPISPINNLAQVFADPQVIAREMVRDVPRSDGQISRVLASPIRLSRSPLREYSPAPRLGQHDPEKEAGWGRV